MEGGEGEGEGSSLPSNYVTIQQLKERWLQQQNPAKPNPHRLLHKPDSPLNPIPNDEAAPLKRNHRIRPRRRGFTKPEAAADASDSGLKTQIDDHPKGRDKEKKEHSNSNSKSELSNNKNSYRGRKPRFVTDKNPNGDSVGPETVTMDKIQTQQLGVRRSLNQKPKDKVPPLANKDAGDVAIAAAVTRSISDGRNRMRAYERPKPWKPPFGVKKGQTSLVWVKKGESPAN